MPAEFARDGIQFVYPENWTAEPEEGDDGWSVTVQSPGTAFLTLICRTDRPAAQAMADTTLAALRDDYPELEAEALTAELAGHHATGHTIRFFSLDMTNTCWTRAARFPVGTLLLLGQASDLDPDYMPQVLLAVAASLRVLG